MPLLVTGFHGCHIETAMNIVSGVGFKHSENGYDWLGTGVYFWEDAPDRAAEWAHSRFGTDGAVISATITLGNSLNLLDITHFNWLKDSYNGLVTRSLNLPTNKNKRHYLDYIVVDTYCEDTIVQGASPFQTVRACFPEGPALYPGSRILRETHIQVSVRDSDCISNLAVVK